MSMASTRRSIQVYRGARRKLVPAFDVGTTYSGISYRLYILHCDAVNRISIQVADACFDSLLVPGEVPRIEGVTR